MSPVLADGSAAMAPAPAMNAPLAGAETSPTRVSSLTRNWVNSVCARSMYAPSDKAGRETLAWPRPVLDQSESSITRASAVIRPPGPVTSKRTQTGRVEKSMGCGSEAGVRWSAATEMFGPVASAT